MSFFSFLQPVEHAVSNVAHAAGNVERATAAPVFNFLKSTGVGAVNTVKNTGDILNATRQATAGYIQGSTAALTNNPVAEKNAIQKTNKAVNYSLNASRGALTPAEASSTSGTGIIKPIARNVAAIAPLVLPVGKIAEGASLPFKFLAKTATNAAVAGGSNAATQAVNTGHVDLGQVATATGEGAALGAAGEAVPLLAKGAKTAVENRTPIDGNQIGAVGSDVRTPEAPLTPDDLHKLSSADTVRQVETILQGKVDPTVINKVAPAIIQAKDPGIIDNIVTRTANPKPIETIAPVDTSVPPSTVPAESPSLAPTVKPDAKVGEQTLKDLANTSNSVDEFHQKLQQLPEDANVRAAIEKSGANGVDELYHTINPDPFRDINAALTGKPGSKGIETARTEQNALLTQERGQRFGASAAAGAEKAGSSGYFAEKAALKGEYTKVPYKPLISDLGPEKAENLFSQARDKILATPDNVYNELGLHPGGARLNTQTAVRKVLGLEPGLPTTSEIRLLKVFSPDVAKIAEDARPRFHQLMDFAAKAFGAVRGLKSTADFSMGGRQGLFVAARHPVEWALANKESVKYAGSGQYFKEQMSNIAGDDWVKVGDQHGLQLPATGLKPEEQYAGSDIIQGHAAKDILKIGNVVAGAERAYDGGLTYLRAALWKSRLQSFGNTPEAAAEKLGQKGMAGLAEAINTLTGRGGKDNGFVTNHINTLAETLFSPRLWASRLEPLNPKFWARIGPAGRQEALQSLGSFAALASVVLGAAAASGAQVETDPRSSDFLKIKVGDTRYDLLGGFQQNLVFGWRELTGEKKSSTTGAINKFAPGITDIGNKNRLPVKSGFGAPNRVSILTDLAGNKLNPVLSSGKKILSGQDASGQPVNYATEIGQLFVPISIQGTAQTISSTGSIPEGIIKNAPDFFGVGSQTYGVNSNSITTKQKQYIQKLQSSGAPQDQITASKLFYQTIKTVPSKNYTYGQIDAALKQGNQTKAIQLAKDYNAQFSKAFDNWRKQYPQYRNDSTLTASYVTRQITDDELQQRIDKLNPGG